MMICAVEFVRDRIVRMIAPERPQHGPGDEKQGKSSTPGKDFAGKPRDPWAVST
jgi:hypothetical protein